MTNITFKNGLPLLLQPAPGSDIGLVAADSGCCCPPPPPERCWCGGFCSYFIELVEPSELAVKTTAIDCTNQSSSEGKTIPTLLTAIFAVTGQEIWPTERNQSTSSVSNFGSLVAVSECELIGNDDFVEGDPGQNYQLFSAKRSVGFSVACGLDSESGQPVMKGRLSLTLEAGFSNFASLGGYMGSEGVRRTYRGEFDIPSTCVVSPERECFPELYDSPEFLRIDTPLEITINGDGTSSLGSLDLTADETFGDGDFGLAEDAIGVLAEATSYTFRITARENCLPPEPLCPCNCSGSGFEFCDPFEQVDLSYGSGCGDPELTANQYDIPCAQVEFADFSDIKAYFGTTAQGYPFSLQWLKDSAVELYDGEPCSFAIHQCHQVRVSVSRCMRGDECICLNGSATTTFDYYVQFFDCELEAWVDITDDILTENRTVGLNPGNVLGPANGCDDCEFDNGNPPEPPPDPGPCEYGITAGECENITGNFP